MIIVKNGVCWFVVFSAIFYLVLNVMGLAPTNAPPVISLVVLPVSIGVWWWTWKKFNQAFAARRPVGLGDGRSAYLFSLRSPTLKYYFTALEVFLPAMGANGLITLDLHEGGWRTFYIWNFILLFAYAIPSLTKNIRHLRWQLRARLIFDGQSFSLQEGDASPMPLSFDREDIGELSADMPVACKDGRLTVGRQTPKSLYCVDGIVDVLRKGEVQNDSPIPT